MRKTFLTFCAAALALLAVSSCGKLEDGLNSLKGEVADLKDRVEKLEKKLNDEVAALQTTMATLATKEEVNSALATLKTSLEAKDAELATAIQGVSTTLAGLDAKYVGKSVYDAAMAELAANNTALEAELETLALLLGQTVEELEDDYLAAIAEAVASVTVTAVENEDGNVVITLANGNSFTVAKPDSNANNTGLVTVDEDGNWCVILEDGTLKSLDAKVGVEELEFQVDPETKELLYSVNGGEFEGTGAYASDADYTVVTDCYEDEDFFYIFVGGVEYALVKATTSTTDLNLLAGKTYFENGQTKVVNFTVTDVKSAFVASAPKGWDVELDFAKRTITVTAPAEGTSEGNVEVWLLGNDGVVKAAFLPVVCGPAVITIDVDPQTNAVSMTFNQMMIEDEYDGSVAMRTPEVYYGATLASEFFAKRDQLLANLQYLPYDPTSGVHSNLNDNNPYDYESRTTSFEGTVADLAYNVNYNAEYVVWAFIPEWTKDWEIANQDDFVYVCHQMNAVNFESEASLSDAELSIEFLDPNVIGFYGIYLPEGYRDMILENLESGEWTLEGQIFSGMFGTEVPCCYYESSSLEVKMSEFGWAADWIAEGGRTVILPVSTSTLCLVPAYEGKVEYAYEDIILKEVKTQDVSLGSSLEYTVTENVDYTGFTVNVVCADAVFAMYYIYNTAKVVVPETDQDVLDMLSAYYIPQPFMYGMYSGSMSIEHRASYGEEPGTEYEFVLVLIDENAKVVVERKTITTKVLPLNNNLTVAVEAYIDDLSEKSTAKFTVGEGAKKLYYTCNTGTTMDIDSQIEILNNESDWEVIELTDDATTYTVEGFKVKTYSWMDVTNYVHAILVDEEGNVSKVFTSAGFNVKKGFQQ